MSHSSWVVRITGTAFGLDRLDDGHFGEVIRKPKTKAMTRVFA